MYHCADQLCDTGMMIMVLFAEKMGIQVLDDTFSVAGFEGLHEEGWGNHLFYCQQGELWRRVG